MTENRRGIPELTDTERARWHALKSLISSAAEKSQRGKLTAEAAKAIGAQINAIEAGLDMGKVRDSVHVPDDAGEHHDALTRMLRRIPDGWGRWISCGAGWYPLLVKLDASLAALDPNYALHQVKEKFGTLRFYAHTDKQEIRDAFNALIREAEERSAQTCEGCGAPGYLMRNRWRWFKTLCAACAAADGSRGWVPTDA